MTNFLLMIGALSLALAVWIALWSGFNNEFLMYILWLAVLGLGGGLALG